MERLTKKHERGYYMTIDPTERGDWDGIQRLGELEDAEEQGLLIQLPYKVGTVVYHKRPYVSAFKGIQPYQITNIMITQNKKGEWCKKYRAMLLIAGRTVDSGINFTFDSIGKTVFLTREEAEKKVEE